MRLCPEVHYCVLVVQTLKRDLHLRKFRKLRLYIPHAIPQVITQHGGQGLIRGVLLVILVGNYGRHCRVRVRPSFGLWVSHALLRKNIL